MISKEHSLIAVPLVVAFGLVSCSTDKSPEVDSPGDNSQQQNDPGAGFGDDEIIVIAENLEAPWSLVFHGDTALISERDSARILETDGQNEPREVSAIDGVEPGGEGGLLGIAVRDSYLYAYFTAAEANRVERFALTGEPGALSLGEPETVIDGIPAAGNHNGGRIAFGPDDMLYVTAGDAGNRDYAQNLDSLGGKILRMTPDGAVPGDNPVDDSYVYTYGHRNPQGIAWDDDATMYASEFGQDTWDELNIIEAGKNYGWPVVEGIAEDDQYVDPVQQWQPADASPSGATVNNDRLWIANLRGQNLREVPLNDLAAATEHWVGEYGRLRDVVVAPDGAIWVVTNNTDGRGEPAVNDDRIIRYNPSF